MEDLVFKAVDMAAALGASYAEARYQRNSWRILSLKGDRVIGTSYSSLEGVGVRVIHSGALAFASTSDTSPEGVRRAVEEAVSKARAVSRLRRLRIELSEERLGRASYEVRPRRPFDDLDLQAKLKELKELHTAALNALKRAKLSSSIINYSEGHEEKIIASSDGAYVRSKIPRLEVFVNLLVSSPEKGAVQKWIEIGASQGLEHLEEKRIRDTVAEKASTMEKMLLEGVQPPGERIEVVLGPEIVGLMMHEGIGHPLEADRVLGREAAQAGESYVKPHMVGRERIGSRLANIVEDPTIPGSSGFYLYDDEGVPARARHLYREGVVVELLHNRETARMLGTRSNASARAANYRSEPLVRMGNTYLAPGDMAFEELIEDIRLGVYIRDNMEWNIDDTRWYHRYIGMEAYMIEKGQLTRPVRSPVLEITTGEFLSSIAGVDRSLEFFPGTCGKGEPGQGIPVWMGGPNTRISGVVLGVAPRG